MNKELEAKVVAALEMCQIEFITLAPRLTEPWRENANECAKAAKEALEALAASRSQVAK